MVTWESGPIFALVVYAYLTFRVFWWGIVPLLLIGEQRQGLYHEDLHQMHWERCVLAALPRFGLFLFMFVLPVFAVFEHLVTNGFIARIVDDVHWSVIVPWIVRAIFCLVLLLASAAVLGGLYFRIWRKAEHERRYQRFRNETLMMNAAYRDSLRQLNILRPARGTMGTRQKPKKFWAELA
ncbi:hypothetical protein [Rhizobium rhizogenes]|uniref:hypothetical protein n=1 Tax=Rhizobium rhizogenes TaxID=359 RepID=UPI001572FA56|nr:hypothetical protein [Rhizobium rhizogenes]NTF72700.1 hypothetical protein [Rhizobium rhizogenes]